MHLGGKHSNIPHDKIQGVFQTNLFDIIVILGVAVVAHVSSGSLVPCQPADKQK